MKLFLFVLLLVVISIPSTSGIDYEHVGIAKNDNYTFMIQEYRIYDSTEGQAEEITSFELIPDIFVGQNDTFVVTTINETVWENQGRHYLDIYLTIDDYTVITYVELGYDGSIISPIEWDMITPLWVNARQEDQNWAELLASRSSNWTIIDEFDQAGFSYTNVENFTTLDGIISSINHKKVIYEPNSGVLLEYSSQAKELLIADDDITINYDGIYSFNRIENQKASEDDSNLFGFYVLPALLVLILLKKKSDKTLIN